jgi:hypothetical protein
MTKIPFTVTVDREVYEEFKKICLKKDIKLSTKVNSLIKEWVANNEKEI